MCNQGKTIKLCTCEALEETSVNSWQLLCGSTQQSIMGVMFEHRGGFIEFNHKDYIHEKIVEDLNTGDAFDFDYHPEEGDWTHLNSTQMYQLTEACRYHSMGRLSKDVTIQSCWDADRLDLGRDW